jgi:CrcB protein
MKSDSTGWLLLAIALGGAGGALARYALSGWVQQLHQTAFPWGTAVVNVVGSLAIGFLWQAFYQSEIPPAVRGFLMVGFLGALTTFSTFSLETLVLARMHDVRLALANVVGSNLLCLLAAATGYGLGYLLFRR